MVFHHFITVILILFSIGYNFVPIGIMVMFVHDSSDAARAMGRVMSESKYSVSHLTLSKVVDFVYLGTWAYMRTIVLPFCLIVSMY
jgi:ceramide synthetase